MKNFKTHLASQIGENVVVAELGRRGIVATTFANNLPNIDLLAYANNKSIPIQVKAQTTGNISINASKYLKIEFDGDIQIIKGLVSDVDRKLIFVVVSIGASAADDEFYIFKQGDLQDIVKSGHEEFLSKHNGVRPRNPKSTHAGCSLNSLYKYKDNWQLIFDALNEDCK